MPVSRELDAVRQSARKAAHEFIGALRAPIPDEPARDELRFRVNRDPSPHVASAGSRLAFGNIFLLRVAKTPNLVALDSLTFQVARSRMIRSEKRTQAQPSSTPSRVTVFLETPVMRTVDRIEFPSTRQAITRARSSVLRRFITGSLVADFKHPSGQRLGLRSPHIGGLPLAVHAELDLGICPLAVWQRRASPASSRYIHYSAMRSISSAFAEVTGILP